MKRLALVAAGAVALTVPFAQPATAHNTFVAPAHRSSISALVHFHPAVRTICTAQTANDSGIGIVSQNFEPMFDAYDARGADDFTLVHRCTVREVDVNGQYFNGAGPATSVNVTFFRSQTSGDVGVVMRRRHEQAYTDPSGTGNFQIVLSAPVTFRPGTYWISVQANMDFAAGGEWGWNTNNTAKGQNSQWQNPGDGFATGCKKFKETVKCVPSGEGPDFSFALLK